MQNIRRYSLSLLALLLVFGCFLRFSFAKPVYAAETLFNYKEFVYVTGIENCNLKVSYTFPTMGEISHLGGHYQQLKVPVDVTVQVWNYNPSNVWVQNYITFDFGAVSPYNDTSNSVSRWIFESFDSEDVYLTGVSPTGVHNHWFVQVGIGADSVYNGAPNGLTFPKLQISSFSFRVNMIYQSADYVNSDAFPALTASSITLSLNDGIWMTTESALSSNSQIVQGITEQTQQQQEQYEDFTSPETQESGELIEDTQSEVESKIGLFTFIEDMLIDFFDIFEVDEQSTQLTLPAFSMQIDGVTQQVWQDTTYDLSEIDTQLPALMVAVRFATVSLVYIALINYLIKLYHRIFMEEKT